MTEYMAVNDYEKDSKDPSMIWGRCAWCGKLTVCQSGYMFFKGPKNTIKGQCAWQCMNGEMEPHHPEARRHTGNPVFQDEDVWKIWAKRHPRGAREVMNSGGPRFLYENIAEKRGQSYKGLR